jgi:glutaredoxin-like protein
MPMIKEKHRHEISKALSGITNPVRLLMFTQDFECQFCAQTRSLLEELAELGEMVSLQVKDFVVESRVAKEYGVEKIPAIVVLGEEDFGIRFYGIPGGYEFSTFIETIVAIGRRNSGLEAEVTELLGKLIRPFHLQVMVTPTCPSCHVRSVPMTVINEGRGIVGALPAIELAREVLKASSSRREIWPRDMWQ